MNGSNDNRIRPDFGAFSELLERERRGFFESLSKLASHSTPKAGILGAIAALSYIAGKIIEAGSKLTPLVLFGALVVAAMIVAIVVTVFFVELRNNAKINKKSFDKSTEPTDERQRSEKTGEAP